MTFRSLSSLPVTVNKHQDRALTLVFGSDGQVSLIGYDGGVTSQPSRIFTASDTGAHSVASGPSTVSPLPNLDVTTASPTGASSPTVIPTPTSTLISPSASLSYNSSVNATDTDTNLPSIPTVNYPTPTPTAVSNPKDHGVGAPFYLAIVLASVSFIGCVSAFIAWWIRSRSRKRVLELEDPWLHGNGNSVSDTGSPSTDDVNKSEKGLQTLVGAQAHPYYLPASILQMMARRRTAPLGLRQILGIGLRIPQMIQDSRTQLWNQTSAQPLRAQVRSDYSRN
ncbi:hypothetical protein JVU11DRAFT_11587 [Chiua virens]|nr:hypothetical protein JVU11DRAFT_11587 [Chiua virens]